MKAVILAGGKGTRLEPVTLEIPKPLIPVQGKTLTEHNFDLLKEAGVTDIILSIGHMKEPIKAFYGDGSKFGINITYVEENEPLGTGGWLKLIEHIDDDFIVLNGDNLFNLDFKAMHEFHKRNEATVTIALRHVEDVRSRGVVALDGDKITTFVERPDPENAPSHYINGGYYIFSKDVFNFLPEQTKFMLEHDIFPKVAQANKLFGFKSDAQWFDTGTFERWDRVIKNWRKTDISGV